MSTSGSSNSLSKHTIVNNSNGYFGKYRGQVVDNRDPEMRGKIRAKVPALFGENEIAWALPSSPYAGNGVGFFFIPPVDANVWIEFEEGNLESPIWSGCFWKIGEAPKMPAIPETKLLKTDFATITVNDLPGGGGVTIETKNGLKVVMDMTGIELNNGAAKIKLTPAS